MFGSAEHIVVRVNQLTVSRDVEMKDRWAADFKPRSLRLGTADLTRLPNTF